MCPDGSELVAFKTRCRSVIIQIKARIYILQHDIDNFQIFDLLFENML